jgi:hypothetical protein
MVKSYYQNFNYSSNRIFSLVQIQSKDKHSLEQYLDWKTETKFYFYCSLSKNNPECELGPWPTRAQHASMHQATIWAWAAKAFAHLGLFPVWLPSAIGSDPTVARHFRSNKKKWLAERNPSFSHFLTLSFVLIYRARPFGEASEAAAPLARPLAGARVHPWSGSLYDGPHACT